MSPTESPVLLTVADGVAEVRLNRPTAANALDLPTAQALDAAVASAVADDAVGAILVTGAGARFCGGGDVRSFVAAEDREAHLLEIAHAADGALQRLTGSDKPVVAAVQGAVAGAGLAVMLSCDLVVSARSTVFTSAYSAIALTPDCGLSWLLPRAVGQQRALELLLTGRRLSADEARDWGLVTEVSGDPDDPDQTYADRARELAAALAGGPAYALGQAKRLARAAWSTERKAHGDDESATIAGASLRPESIELVQAFTSR